MEPFELPHRHEDASHLHELEEFLRRTEYFQTVALVFRQLSDANRRAALLAFVPLRGVRGQPRGHDGHEPARALGITCASCVRAD